MRRGMCIIVRKFAILLKLNIFKKRQCAASMCSTNWIFLLDFEVPAGYFTLEVPGYTAQVARWWQFCFAAKQPLYPLLLEGRSFIFTAGPMNLVFVPHSSCVKLVHWRWEQRAAHVAHESHRNGASGFYNAMHTNSQRKSLFKEVLSTV